MRWAVSFPLRVEAPVNILKNDSETAEALGESSNTTLKTQYKISLVDLTNRYRLVRDCADKMAKIVGASTST